MDERLKCVACLLDGEKMAPVCREFGISRKTGYKIFNRCKDVGLEGLHERSRRPLRYANPPPFQAPTKPVSFNFLPPQARFYDFIDEYNNGRPHQALNMKYPDVLYTPLTRIYRVPDEPEYPLHERKVRTTHCGRICIGKRKISLSRVFAGQPMGIREVSDQTWVVSLTGFDLGFFDQDEGRIEPATNPFLPKVLTMSSVQDVTYVSDSDLLELAERTGLEPDVLASPDHLWPLLATSLVSVPLEWSGAVYSQINPSLHASQSKSPPASTLETPRIHDRN